MATSPQALASTLASNRLLRSLKDELRDHILSVGTAVHLEQKQILAEPDEHQDAVYFPGDAVISLITPFKDGSAVEVGTVGCEGMTGLSVFLGSGPMHVLIIAQLPGEALRIPAAEFSAMVESSTRLRTVMGAYAQAFLGQVLQSAACNAHHPIVARCARWMLMTHDRVGAKQFALTHDLLAYMLGVRRAGVTEAAGSLQNDGYIRYSRGRVEIVDRNGLESAACECYGVIRRMYEKLLVDELEEITKSGD